MTGYRDRSSYDPNWGWQEQGPPLRPYNWVQWAGVACLAVSGLAYLSYFAGRAGVIPQMPFEPVTIAMPFLALGISLVYSRRHEAYDPAPELAAARRRWLIYIVALCAFVLGAAAIIEFGGA